jgi:hypothetical protein
VVVVGSCNGWYNKTSDGSHQETLRSLNGNSFGLFDFARHPEISIDLLTTPLQITGEEEVPFSGVSNMKESYTTLR